MTRHLFPPSSLALLASVVLAQVLLLAFQIKRDRDVRSIRYWAVELMTPVERAGTWSFSKSRRRLDRLHRPAQCPHRKCALAQRS